MKRRELYFLECAYGFIPVSCDETDAPVGNGVTLGQWLHELAVAVLLMVREERQGCLLSYGRLGARRTGQGCVLLQCGSRAEFQVQRSTLQNVLPSSLAGDCLAHINQVDSRSRGNFTLSGLPGEGANFVQLEDVGA